MEPSPFLRARERLFLFFGAREFRARERRDDDRPGQRAPERSRPARAGRPAGAEAGFTLVEALVAVALGSLVVAAAFSLFDTQQEAARVEDLRLELQQNARYALDMLRRDLQEAGEGADPRAEFGVVGMLDGGGSSPDSLFVLYVEPETPTHGAAPANGSVSGQDSVWLAITCGDPVDDVEGGDFLYLANGSARGVAVVEGSTREVTGSCAAGDSESKQIGELRLAVDPVDGERHGWTWEEGRNDGSAAFTRVNAVAYYVDDSDPESPELARATRYRPSGPDAGWDGRTLAGGVTDFQTSLIFADGDTLAAADGTDPDPSNDHDDVNSVLVRLTVAARRKDPDLAGGERYQRDYAITVTPRNQVYTRNLQGD